MSSLAWVQDRSWEPRAVAGLAEQPGPVTWATAEPWLAASWRQAGRAVTTPWAAVTPAEQVAIAAEALALVEGWLGGGPDLEFRGVDLAGLGRTGLLHLFRDGLLAARLAEGLLDQAGPERVALAGEDILTAVLGWAAERRGLPVLDLATAGRGRAGSGRRPWAAPARAARDLAEAGRWLAWRAPGPGGVLVAGGGADYANQVPLVERLRAAGTFPVLHLALHPPSMAARGGAGGLPRPDLSLPGFAAPGDGWALRRLGQRAWEAYRAGQLPAASGAPALLANPRLAPAFRRFFLDTLPRAGAALRAAERLLDRARPALVVLNSAASPRERSLLAAAAARGIRSVQLVHSGFNDLHIHQVLADALWVWGPAQRAQFAAAGLAPERLRIVGNPALAPAAPGASRADLGLGEDEVLFLAVTAGGRLLSFTDPEGHRRDLLALCEAVAAAGARLVFKPHPRYDDLASYRELARRFPAAVRLIEAAPLGPLLAACDVAVALNVATTGALEAVLAGKPLLWCRASSAYPPGFDLIAPGALTLGERAAIGPAVMELAGSAAARAALAARAAAYAPELLSVPPAEGAAPAAAAILAELGPRPG
jgi:hypothetical protein